MVGIRIQIVFHILSVGEIIQQMSMERVEMSEDKAMGHMGHSFTGQREGMCKGDLRRINQLRDISRESTEKVFLERGTVQLCQMLLTDLIRQGLRTAHLSWQHSVHWKS